MLQIPRNTAGNGIPAFLMFSGCQTICAHPFQYLFCTFDGTVIMTDWAQFCRQFLCGLPFEMFRRRISEPEIKRRPATDIAKELLPPKTPETPQNQRIIGCTEVLPANSCYSGKAAPLAGMSLIHDFSCPCDAP